MIGDPAPSHMMDTSMKATVVALVNPLWQARYLEAQFRDRWVLPAGHNIPFRQLPWHGMKDSAVPLDNGTRWLLCSSPDGKRYEIITVEKMVDKVVTEYLESRKDGTDIKSFCSNLSKKYAGVLADDAEWIIEAAKQLLPSPKPMGPTQVVDKTPQHSSFQLSRLEAGATSNQEMGQQQVPRNKNIVMPIAPSFSATRGAEHPKAPLKAPALIMPPNPREREIVRAQPIPMATDRDSRQIGRPPPRGPRAWEAKRKPSKFAQRIEEMVTNQVTTPPEWKPASEHHDEWVRRNFSRFRILKPWYAQEAFKGSTRLHQLSELVDSSGRLKRYSEYDDRGVNNSNVIRETHRNSRYRLKTSSVDTDRKRRGYI